MASQQNDDERARTVTYLNGMVKKLRAARPYGAKAQVDIPIEDVRQLVMLTQNRFAEEPTLLELQAPLVVAGDIHGQFDDLIRMFKFCGSPCEARPYLFIGDYVDRGPLSLEVILLLFCYKQLYPDHFHMTRGNHETATISRAYGFYDECQRRYDVRLWREFQVCFDWMPVAAVVSHRIFCVHGGLSPQLTRPSQINAIERPTEIPPDGGLLTDLLWSDPKCDSPGFEPNRRGCSVTFGEPVVKNFCQTNGLDLIIRAHQVVPRGYEFFADQKLITIFSAPEYGHSRNDLGVVDIDEHLTCRVRVLSLKEGN